MFRPLLFWCRALRVKLQSSAGNWLEFFPFSWVFWMWYTKIGWELQIEAIIFLKKSLLLYFHLRFGLDFCCDFYFENESLFIRLLTSFRPYHTIVVVFAQRTRRALFLFFLFLSAHHFWHQTHPPWPSKEIHFSLNAKQQWKGRHSLARVSVATDVTNMTSWGIRADQHTPWALRAVVNKKRFLGKFSYASDPTAPWHI